MILQKPAAFLCSLLLATVVGLGGGLTDMGQADAQQAGKRNTVSTKLTKAQIQTLRQFFKGGDFGTGTDAPPIDFKVPAIPRTEVVCKMGPSGINCYESLVDMKCPTAVEVLLPDGSRTTAPVDCTGPNSQGECDCDFS